MIISASRRTDIPAFYSEWFMNRIRAGFVLVRNPFNAKQVRRISLARGDVETIVFWTRNPASLMPHLQQLDELGYRYYFQYTITGYPRQLEQSVPRPQAAIDTFRRLSDRIGPNRIIWRYDPILFSPLADVDEHRRLFAKIAGILEGHTRRVVVSFADIYNRVRKNLATALEMPAEMLVLDKALVAEISCYMSSVAATHGMSIRSCAEEIDLSGYGIPSGKCIDDELIGEIFGIDVSHRKDKGQREACGCVESVDIGQYNSCLHGCAYCYATSNKKLARSNFEKHHPESPFLIGLPDFESRDVDHEKESPQGDLF